MRGGGNKPAVTKKKQHVHCLRSFTFSPARDGRTFFSMERRHGVVAARFIHPQPVVCCLPGTRQRTQGRDSDAFNARGRLAALASLRVTIYQTFLDSGQGCLCPESRLAGSPRNPAHASGEDTSVKSKTERLNCRDTYNRADFKGLLFVTSTLSAFCVLLITYLLVSSN